MKTKRLTSEAEQAAFVTAFQENDGTPIATNYLQHSHVWGCYQNGHLVAGFIINRSPCLRYLEYFTESFSRQLLAAHQLANVTEITCIWHERNRPFSLIQKTELYLQSVLKAINWQSWLSDAPIMGGSFSEKVAKRQKTLLSTQLFREPIKINGQLKIAQIYYARTRQIFLRFPIAIGLMISQEIIKTVMARKLVKQT